MTHPRQHLAEAAALAHQVEQAERNILARAHASLEKTQAEIARLRPLALVPGAKESDQYQEAIMERARLGTVIAQARRVLEKK